MGNFAENLNLGNRFRPPPVYTYKEGLPPCDHQKSYTVLAQKGAWNYAYFKYSSQYTKFS